MATLPIVISNMLVTTDGHKIAYTYYNAGHKKVAVIAHGFYNSKDAVVLQELAKGLSDEYDVFMFDFRGHGKSSGLFTWTAKEEKDLKAALDFLEGKYIKKGLIAFSLGASIGINVLSKDERVDSFICVSAPCNFDKVDYHFWELDWEDDLVYTLFSKEGSKGKGLRPGPFWLKKEKPIDNVGKIKIPVLYIHGEKDWVIKPWHSKALYEKTASPKRMAFVKDGTHAEYLIRDKKEEIMTLIKGWFSETL